MALCAKCKGPTTVKVSSRDTRHAFYKALVAAGAEQCPECREYVILAGHDCAAYWEPAGWAAVMEESSARYRAAESAA